MMLRRYHRPPDVDDDQVDEKPTHAPPATKPAGRAAAHNKGAAKPDGG